MPLEGLDMNLPIFTEMVPLSSDSDGVVRVGKTRVTLDTVIEAFLDGVSAEEIVCQYPSLELPDVYAVIAYYLRRRVEVDDYLQWRSAQTENIQKQNQTRVSPIGVRARLHTLRGTVQDPPIPIFPVLI